MHLEARATNVDRDEAEVSQHCCSISEFVVARAGLRSVVLRLVVAVVVRVSLVRLGFSSLSVKLKQSHWNTLSVKEAHQREQVAAPGCVCCIYSNEICHVTVIALFASQSRRSWPSS